MSRKQTLSHSSDSIGSQGSSTSHTSTSSDVSVSTTISTSSSSSTSSTSTTSHSSASSSSVKSSIINTSVPPSTRSINPNITHTPIIMDTSPRTLNSNDHHTTHSLAYTDTLTDKNQNHNVSTYSNTAHSNVHYNNIHNVSNNSIISEMAYTHPPNNLRASPTLNRLIDTKTSITTPEPQRLINTHKLLSSDINTPSRNHLKLTSESSNAKDIVSRNAPPNTLQSLSDNSNSTQYLRASNIINYNQINQNDYHRAHTSNSIPNSQFTYPSSQYRAHDDTHVKHTPMFINHNRQSPSNHTKSHTRTHMLSNDPNYLIHSQSNTLNFNNNIPDSITQSTSHTQTPTYMTTSRNYKAQHMRSNEHVIKDEANRTLMHDPQSFRTHNHTMSDEHMSYTHNYDERVRYSPQSSQHMVDNTLPYGTGYDVHRQLTPSNMISSPHTYNDTSSINTHVNADSRLRLDSQRAPNPRHETHQAYSNISRNVKFDDYNTMVDYNDRTHTSNVYPSNVTFNAPIYKSQTYPMDSHTYTTPTNNHHLHQSYINHYNNPSEINHVSPHHASSMIPSSSIQRDNDSPNPTKIDDETQIQRYLRSHTSKKHTKSNRQQSTNSTHQKSSSQFMDSKFSKNMEFKKRKYAEYKQMIDKYPDCPKLKRDITLESDFKTLMAAITFNQQVISELECISSLKSYACMGTTFIAGLAPKIFNQHQMTTSVEEFISDNQNDILVIRQSYKKKFEPIQYRNNPIVSLLSKGGSFLCKRLLNLPLNTHSSKTDVMLKLYEKLNESNSDIPSIPEADQRIDDAFGNFNVYDSDSSKSDVSDEYSNIQNENNNYLVNSASIVSDHHANENTNTTRQEVYTPEIQSSNNLKSSSNNLPSDLTRNNDQELEDFF